MAGKSPFNAETEIHVRLRRAFFLPFFFLAFLAVLLSFQVKRLSTALLWLDHTDRVLAKANYIEKLLIDLETGFRGYLLSNDRQFLQPYFEAHGSLTSELEIFEQMTSDNPSQTTKIMELTNQIQDWISYAEKMIRQKVRRQLRDHFEDKEGKLKMDGVREKIGEIKKVEEDVRKQRLSSSDSQVAITWITTALLTLLIAILLAYFSRAQVLAVGKAYSQKVEELRQDREQLRALLEGIKGYAIVGLDPKGRINSWNTSAQSVTGYTFSDSIGKDFSFLYSSEDRSEDYFVRLLDSVKRDGKVEDESWLKRKDGSKYWGDVVLTSLYDPTGGLRGYCLVCRDFSDRRKREADRSFLLNKLQESVAARDEFLSLASHELRTPLTSMTLQFQSLERKAKNAEKIEMPPSAFQLLKRNLARMIRLVDSMLDITRLHVGALAVEFKVVNLSQLVEQIVGDYDEQFKSVSCEIESDIEPNLVGMFDQSRMEQVVQNLLSNGLKYGCGKRINVKLEKLDDKARLSVKDFGPGVSSEMQQRLFNRFQRGIDTTAGGLGLGLYIAKNIVESHGGTIRIESKLNEGSNFIVELPLA